MKRALFFAAVVLLATTWSTPARAQFGFGGGGGNKDPLADIAQQRSKIKSRLSQYSRHSAGSRAKVANPASTDELGRMDLAGRAVAGYPIVRGDLRGHTYVSRGGANGSGRRHYSPRRR